MSIDEARTVTSPTRVSRRSLRLAVLDQRDVGRGAAHVEGQQVREARLLGDPERAGDAAGRPGHQQVDRDSIAEPAEARPPSERRMCRLHAAHLVGQLRACRLCT